MMSNLVRTPAALLLSVMTTSGVPSLNARYTWSISDWQSNCGNGLPITVLTFISAGFLRSYGLHGDDVVHRAGIRAVFAYHRQLVDLVFLHEVDRPLHAVVRSDGDDSRYVLSHLLAVQKIACVVGVTGGGQEAVLLHPLVGEHLAQITAPAVRHEHHDYVLVRHVLRDAQGGDRRRARRAADENALLSGQPPAHDEGVFVADPNYIVEKLEVDRSRDEVLADAFHLVRRRHVAGVDRAFRIDADNLDFRVLLLEVASGTGYGAARADAGHEAGDLAVGLLPDLRSGRPVMRLRVVRVGELVGLEGSGDLQRQFVGHRIVALVRACRNRGGDDYHFGAVRLQKIDLLGGYFVRHHQDAPVAADRGYLSQPRPRIAGGRLDYGAARLEEPLLFRLVDHLGGRAILHGPARVEGLYLAQDKRLQSGRHLV